MEPNNEDDSISSMNEPIPAKIKQPIKQPNEKLPPISPPPKLPLQKEEAEEDKNQEDAESIEKELNEFIKDNQHQDSGKDVLSDDLVPKEASENSKSQEKKNEKICKVDFKYSRKYGFSKCKWTDFKSKATKRAERFLRQYCDSIEKEAKFRDVSTSKIERVLLILTLLIFILIMTIGDWIVGTVCLCTLLGVVYFLAIRKSLKLKGLKKKYSSKLEGTDFNYFGVKISNKFGYKNCIFYACVPFISATIVLNLIIYVR